MLFLQSYRSGPQFLSPTLLSWPWTRLFIGEGQIRSTHCNLSECFPPPPPGVLLGLVYIIIRFSYRVSTRLSRVGQECVCSLFFVLLVFYILYWTSGATSELTAPSHWQLCDIHLLKDRWLSKPCAGYI